MSKVEQDKQSDMAPINDVGVAPPEQSSDSSRRHDWAASWKAWRRTLAASRMLRVLGVALVVQLLLAGGMYWHGARDGQFVVAEQLLAFDTNNADRLQIISADAELVLTRKEGVWQLEGDQVLPADDEKVEQFLTQLADLKAGLPVATSTASRGQLEVAEDDFQRHIRVEQGDQILADLYVGTSPGYQRAHVRRAGDDAIVAANLNVYDMPEELDGWMDRELLSFNDVSRIETDQFTLSRSGDEWRIEAPPARVADHQVAEEPLDRILKTLQALRVTGLAVAAEDQDAAEASVSTAEQDSASDVDASDEEASVIAWKVSEQGADPLTLTLSRQGDEVTVERSDWPLVFKTSVSVFDSLNDVDLAELLPEKPKEGSDAEQGESDIDEAESNATMDDSAAGSTVEEPVIADEPADNPASRAMSAE